MGFCDEDLPFQVSREFDPTLGLSWPGRGSESSPGRREFREVVQGFGVGQRFTGRRLLRGGAHQDPLDRDLQHLVRECAWHGGDLADLVWNVARRTVLSDPPTDLADERVI